MKLISTSLLVLLLNVLLLSELHCNAYNVDPPQQIRLSLSGKPTEMVVSWITNLPTNASVVSYWPVASFVNTHNVDNNNNDNNNMIIDDGVDSTSNMQIQQQRKALAKFQLQLEQKLHTTKQQQQQQQVHSINNQPQQATGSYILFVDPEPAHQKRYVHTVLVTDLELNTLYEYQVGDGVSVWSEVYSFKTLSNSNDVMRMIVYGDLGLINSQSLALVQSEVLEGHAEVLLHVGDFAYDLHTSNGLIGDLWANYIQPISANIPYMGCIGNHEGKYNFSHYTYRYAAYSYLGDNSNAPGNNWWFSWDYVSGGAVVHMVAITSEVYYVYVDEFPPPDLTPQLKAQYYWLQQDLAKARQRGVDWIVVYGHRPMYCSNDDGDDCTVDATTLRVGVNGTTAYGLEVILQQYNVDIYLCAHEHSYERTFPVFNNTIDPNNNKDVNHFVKPTYPIHIISGSAGNQENIDEFHKQNISDWSAVRSPTYGYGHLLVHNKTHLYWEQLIDEGNQANDYFWIVKD